MPDIDWNDPDAKKALDAKVSESIAPFEDSISKLESKNKELLGEKKKAQEKSAESDAALQALASKTEEMVHKIEDLEVAAGKKKDDEDVVKEPRILSKFREALTYAPGQQLPTALGTYWGAYNAVSYTIDHSLGRNRDTALRNAWMGHQASVKRRAFSLALKRAA